MDVILIGFMGYIAGAVFRTLYDFLWKMLEDPDVVFDKKYIVTMLISIILSLISSIIAFPSIQIPSDGVLYVFLNTAVFGFALNHVVNKAVSYLSKKGP